MQVFKDRHGKDWSIEITVGQIKRVRSSLGVDLYSLIEDNLAGLQKLLGDPVTLIDVVYVLCRDQCLARDVDDIAFGESVAGQSLADIGQAFLEAYLDFFPDRSVAETLRKMLAKGNEAVAILSREANEKLSEVSAEFLAEKLKQRAGNSPES